MSNNAQINTEKSVGGWSAYTTPTPAELKIFKEAINGLLGVNYKPTAVSTQLVAGTNFRFKALATVILSGLIYEVIVSIYQPLSGEPKLIEITPI